MISLVLMPFCDIERPSLALGLLKGALKRNGISADIIYANLIFAQHVGIHASSLPLRMWPTSLIGEWVFASAAFPDFSPCDDRYLEECIVPFARAYSHGDPLPLVLALRKEFMRMRKAAPAFIDQLARDLLAKQPKIVGCSSSFFQQVSSLALLRRVRELDTEVVTLIGGANVEGEMGATVVRVFPWVDAICSGEADETVVSLCRSVMKWGRAGLKQQLPEGVLTRDMASHCTSTNSTASRVTVSDLDALPIPDYDDYFKSLARFSDSDRLLIHSTLPMETSRGCWWSNTDACTFCGLNHGNHAYRTKNPARVCTELETLTNRYNLRNFAMADNVLPPSYLKTLFPELERQQATYDLFYEIRPIMQRNQARLLFSAGVRHVQAGIESLHDGLLTLINKGSTVLQNIALLKHAAEFGIIVGWNLLTGFPGDSDDWYSKTASLLPLLYHLQPPKSLHGITLQRFSAYMTNPDRYGLNPVPYNNYEVIYPLPTSTISQLAYYFRDESWPEFYPEMNRETDGIRCLIVASEEWRRAYLSPSPPQLTVKEHDAETLVFMDTRSCAVSHNIILQGLSAHVYRLAEDPIEIDTIPDQLSVQGIQTSSVLLHNALTELIDQCLAIRISNRLLSLAIPERYTNRSATAAGKDISEDAFHRYLTTLAKHV